MTYNPVLGNTNSINFGFDGGGQTLLVGASGWSYVKNACTIASVTCLADQTGSITVEVWKDSYANYPPDSSDKISASAPITISSSNKSQDTTLTGWTTSISAGDVLKFLITSVTSIQNVQISIGVK